MVKFVVTFSLFLFAIAAVAQILDFDAIEKMPATINTEAEESMPLVSPDGNKLYFVRILSNENIGGKYTGHDVWMSERKGTTWTKANNKFPFNNKNNNAVIGISSDGSILYLMDASSSKKINGIFFSRKHNGTWNKPEFVPVPGFDGIGSAGFYVSPDFKVIFISMRGRDTKGEEDLYISLKTNSGIWSVPKNLGPVINTNGFEISPFLSTDKQRLYFASNGHEGLGNADIFYCDRLYGSWETWSAPRNLGPKINSDKFDAFFSIYGDTLAYFSSDRSGKLADLYKAKVSPGDEIYAITQRYLHEKEMNDLLGGKISRRIVFERNAVDLNGQQKELLYFIANKLLHKGDVNFHIIMSEEDDPELSSKRQTVVYDFLRQSGIESHRMIMSTGKFKNNSKSTNGVVEIILFQ